MNAEDVKTILSIAASGTTLLAFLGIGIKPIRKVIKGWLDDLFTYQVRMDMNTGFAALQIEISKLVRESTKERLLNNRRHASNSKQIKEIAKSLEVGLTVANHRLDEHETDLIAHRKATEENR